MGSNPIGPNGPHLEENESQPVTGGAAVKRKKEGEKEETKEGKMQAEGIGPNGPHSAPISPTKPADIGPDGPHTT